jgi:uncharacterized protein
MTFDRLDGFLSALAAGPSAAVPPEVWPEAIWGTAGSGGVFADSAQAEYVMGLIRRHLVAIQRRLENGHGHAPEIRSIFRGDGLDEWGLGFLDGIELAMQAWEPLRKDRRRGKPLLAPILYAATADARHYPDGDVPATTDDHVAEIAGTLTELWAYWRQPSELIGPQRLVRAAPKPGRNQPCPCGSGKKYKRCCGSELRAESA